MNSGIYTITNLVNEKIYVGLAVDIDDRWRVHLSDLRTNMHHSEHLQRAWSKYGEENFKFEILVECPEEYLYSEEHYWATLLNVHNRKYGYNIRPTHPYGTPRLADSTKQKLSIINKGQDNSWRNRIVLQFDMKGNFIAEHESCGIAARYANVDNSAISGACRGKTKFCSGYFWTYKNTYDPSNLNIVKRKNNRFVAAIDLSGNIIREFRTLIAAAKYAGTCPSAVTYSINENRECKGVKFVYLSDCTMIYKAGKKQAAFTRTVFCITNNKTYDSIKEAAIELGLRQSLIGEVCRGVQTHTGGYKFKFV